MNKEHMREYCADLVNLYRYYCPHLPKASKITKQKQIELMELLKTYHYHNFVDLFTLAQRSPLLNGKSNRGWTANFDWLTTPENMKKVISDQYSPTRCMMEQAADLSLYKIHLEIHQENGLIIHLDREM